MTQLTLQTAIDWYRQQAIKSSEKARKSTPSDEYWEPYPKFEEVRTCVGESFAGTDDVVGEPLVDWSSSDLKKMDWYTIKHHQDACTFIMGFPIYEDMHKKNTLVVAKRVFSDDKRKKGVLASTAVVMEYDPSKQTTTFFSNLLKQWLQMMAFLTMLLSAPLPALFSDRGNREAAKNFEKKGVAMLSTLERSHKEKGPQHLHWYVHLVAVHPTFHGKGYGKELMAKVNELADAAGAMLYLECGMPNVTFYEKMGYGVHSLKTVNDPLDHNAAPGEGAIMIRQPNKK